MARVRFVPVSPDEREGLEAAFRDFEQHFAQLLRPPQVLRPFEGDPFAMPGWEIYWLEWEGKPYGFVVLAKVTLPPSRAEDKVVSQVEATQITYYGIFSGFRNRGLGSAGLPLLEAYALASGHPLTWGCWLMNPALKFWERWAHQLVRKGWHVDKHPRESSPPACLYIAWPPGTDAVSNPLF
jgi:GNAT superfamily N-acetyltransferase